VALTYLVVTVAPVLPESPTFAQAVVNLTMLQMPLGSPQVDPVYWTLWVELRFYLLFALVVATGLTYRKVVFFAAAWTLLTPFARAGDSGLLKLLLVPDYSSYFLVGIGLYLLHRFGNQVLTWALIGINVAVCVFRGEQRVVSMGQEWVDSPMQPWIATVIILVAIGLIMAIAQGRLDWMQWKWLTYAGALTYPFYLLHQMIGYSLIHHLYVERGISAYAVLPATLGATLLLAWLVHRFVERPLAGVIKRQLSGSLLDPRAR
jgi:peptidoglycan/LPS O-acetylase OafA/YrhL